MPQTRRSPQGGDQIGNKHVVAIVKTGSICEVVPEKLLAGIGDVVVFQNLTLDTVLVQFSEKSVFDTSEIELPDNGQKILQVKNVFHGSYSYYVTCKHKKSEGKKSLASISTTSTAAIPVIIIYKPIT